MKTRFVTTDYEFSHGKKPRGFGSWVFFSDRSCETEFCWVHQSTYANARKEANRRAAEAGVDTLYVGS